MAGFVSYALTDRVAYPHPDGANGAFGAFVFEVIYTTYLVFIVLCVATPTSEIDAQDGTDEDTPQSYYGMAIGFTVGAGTQHSAAQHSKATRNRSKRIIVALVLRHDSPTGSFCAGITGGGSGGVFNPAVGTGLGIADVVMLKVPGNGIWVAWVSIVIGQRACGRPPPNPAAVCCCTQCLGLVDLFARTHTGCAVAWCHCGPHSLYLAAFTPGALRLQALVASL